MQQKKRHSLPKTCLIFVHFRLETVTKPPQYFKTKILSKTHIFIFNSLISLIFQALTYEGKKRHESI